MITPNQNYDSKISIMESGATTHRVKPEENMTNLKDTETKVTVVDSTTLTRTKCGDRHGYQTRYGKIHHVTTSSIM